MGQTFKFGTFKNTDYLFNVTYRPTINNGFDLKRLAANSGSSGTYNGLSNYFGTYPAIPSTRTFYFTITIENLYKYNHFIISHKNSIIVPHLKQGQTQSKIGSAYINIYNNVDLDGNFIDAIATNINVKPDTRVTSGSDEDGSYKLVDLNSYLNQYNCLTDPTAKIYYFNNVNYYLIDNLLSPDTINWNTGYGSVLGNSGFVVDSDCEITNLENISAIGSLHDYPHFIVLAKNTNSTYQDIVIKYSIEYSLI